LRLARIAAKIASPAFAPGRPSAQCFLFPDPPAHRGGGLSGLTGGRPSRGCHRRKAGKAARIGGGADPGAVLCSSRGSAWRLQRRPRPGPPGIPRRRRCGIIHPRACRRETGSLPVRAPLPAHGRSASPGRCGRRTQFGWCAGLRQLAVSRGFIERVVGGTLGFASPPCCPSVRGDGAAQGCSRMALTSQACQRFRSHFPRPLRSKRRAGAFQRWGALRRWQLPGRSRRRKPQVVFWTRRRCPRFCRGHKRCPQQGVGPPAAAASSAMGRPGLAGRASAFPPPVQKTPFQPLQDRPIEPAVAPPSPVAIEPAGIPCATSPLGQRRGCRAGARGSADRPQPAWLSGEVRTSMAPLPLTPSPPPLQRRSSTSARPLRKTRSPAGRPGVAGPPPSPPFRWLT